MGAIHRYNMVKVARCGSITCWRIASAVLIVLGLVCLAIGFGVMFSGDPSMGECMSNNNYICDSGCNGDTVDDCDATNPYASSLPLYPDVDGSCSEASFGSSSSGTYNLYKACKCTSAAKCDKTKGTYAAYGLGAAFLVIGIIFLCGCCPCACFAKEEHCEEEHRQTQQAVVAQVYDPTGPPGHPAPVTMGPLTVIGQTKDEPTIQA